MKLIITLFCTLSALYGSAQLDILSTNPIAEQVLLGDFDPADYAAEIVIDDHDEIISDDSSYFSSSSRRSWRTPVR